MRVIINCVSCSNDHTVEIDDLDGYMAWKEGGALIQDALPKLTADQREMLISRLCPTCFRAMCEVDPHDDLDDDSGQYHEDMLDRDEEFYHND